MARPQETFDPRAIIAALERNYVDYVIIGALARVLRGTYETTRGVDICPSFGAVNMEQLKNAANDLEARRTDGRDFVFEDRTLSAEDVIAFSTSAGELKIVPVPAGAPSGFVDLRRAATKEDLGHGLRPLVASTGDLARMAAALHRDQDVERLPELRRIMELEVDREAVIAPAQVRGPTQLRGRWRSPTRISDRAPERHLGLER
jgi:hypothetical protein